MTYIHRQKLRISELRKALYLDRYYIIYIYSTGSKYL